MMLVPTYVGPSPIHGVGMFAVNAIRKGTVLWEFTHGFDRTFTQATYDYMPELARLYVARHGFLAASRVWVISGDHDQYVNHSQSPNMIESDQPFSITAPLIAARDILGGEELTQNYMEWDMFIQGKKLP